MPQKKNINENLDKALLVKIGLLNLLHIVENMTSNALSDNAQSLGISPDRKNNAATARYHDLILNFPDHQHSKEYNAHVDFLAMLKQKAPHANLDPRAFHIQAQENYLNSFGVLV
jgi:hypothetical protein